MRMSLPEAALVEHGPAGGKCQALALLSVNAALHQRIRQGASVGGARLKQKKPLPEGSGPKLSRWISSGRCRYQP